MDPAPTACGVTVLELVTVTAGTLHQETKFQINLLVPERSALRLAE